MTIEQIQPEREPVEILIEKATIKLKELFPGKNVEKIVDSFLIDLLHANKIPSSLDRMLPERQKELLLLNGAQTVNDSIAKMLSSIPDSLLQFYEKKLAKTQSKNFDIE